VGAALAGEASLDHSPEMPWASEGRYGEIGWNGQNKELLGDKCAIYRDQQGISWGSGIVFETTKMDGVSWGATVPQLTRAPTGIDGFVSAVGSAQSRRNREQSLKAFDRWLHREGNEFIKNW
jgi:hypothetical protein